MKNITDEKNFEKWALIIEKCCSSGIYVRHWCCGNNAGENNSIIGNAILKQKI